MKHRYLFLFMFFLPYQLLAQDTLGRTVYVGFDVLKNVWPLFSLYPEVRSAYTIEPSVQIQLKRPGRYLHINPGFTSFSGNHQTADIRGNTLSGRGFYLKVGLEYRKRNFGVGYAGLVSGWRDQGTYRIKGSYFGDYSGIIPPKNRVAVGGEFFVSLFGHISKRLAIRFMPRVNILAPFTSYSERPDPPFLPGIGLFEGSRWRVSAGVSLQLFYLTSSR